MDKLKLCEDFNSRGKKVDEFNLEMISLFNFVKAFEYLCVIAFIYLHNVNQSQNLLTIIYCNK